MYIVEIFLPLADNSGEPFPASLFRIEKAFLLEVFGGVTTYSRQPAEGLWVKEGHRMDDDMVIFEVMTDNLDESWWQTYRRRIEVAFRQDSIVIRAFTAQRL